MKTIISVLPLVMFQCHINGETQSLSKIRHMSMVRERKDVHGKIQRQSLVRYVHL